MKKLILALVSFFSISGVMAQTVQSRRVVVDCEDKDWQTLDGLKWDKIKRAEQKAKVASQAARNLLSKLSSFEQELDAWHRNILNANSYQNPNTIKDEKEKSELLQKIKNDPNAIINRAKQGYKLGGDLGLMMKFGNQVSQEVVGHLRYLSRNLGEKSQAFNKYHSSQTTSSQKDAAHKVLVRDFDYKEAISKIRALLQK